MAYQTFGRTTRNARNRAPITCLILTLFLMILRYDPLAPTRDLRTLLKSNLSTITTVTQAATIANAGAALNMNLAAEIAMNMAAPSQTTMNMYSDVAFFGTFRNAQTSPINDMKNVTMPNPSASSLNLGAFASAMVEYSLFWTKYPWPLRIAWPSAGSITLIISTPTIRIMAIAGKVSVHGKSRETTNNMPRIIDAKNRYTGTSNRTAISVCSKYTGNDRRKPNPIATNTMNVMLVESRFLNLFNRIWIR